MGTISRVLSSLSRFTALVSSIIVAGLLGRFVRNLRRFGFNGGSKVIYTLALSGISIFFALILLVPLNFQFWAFPFDFAMFVMWIVAFALLTNVRLPPPLSTYTNLNIPLGNPRTGKSREETELTPWQLSPDCGGSWHTFVWRFAWGSNRCNIWRTILAFCFIAAMAWLFSAALGMYRVIRDRKNGGGAAADSQ